MENETKYGHVSSVKEYFLFEKKDDINHQLDKDILRPFIHIAAVPGKLIRKKYTEALNIWMKIPNEKLKIIDEIAFNVHNGALLLDDIQDRADLRRSVPTAHTVFGLGRTVISADFVFALTLTKVMELNHPQAMEIYINNLVKAIEGQGMEIYWRDNFICPTEEEYKQMVNGKTGTMLVGLLKFMALFSNENKDVQRFSETLGWYYQIKDDYQNLISEEYFDSKGFCEDISEGKFGFPTVHAINTHPKEVNSDILRQRTRDVELKKYCLSLIEKCGSFEYTRNVLKLLEDSLQEEIRKLGETNMIEEFLQNLYKLSI